MDRQATCVKVMFTFGSDCECMKKRSYDYADI